MWADLALLLVAGLFLPLFPLSIALNAALTRLRNPLARFALLLLWPQIGVVALQATQQAIPEWIVAWALLSSGFYALRLLTVRDLGLWAGFLAASALALTWSLADTGAGATDLGLFAFWFSLPAALLALLAGPLTRRFGAAYAGLYGGLANSLPRWSGLLVVTLLIAIATPPFPGFFAMLALLQGLEWPAAPGVMLIWLTWGWAATRLMQGFVFGADRGEAVGDLGRPATLAYLSALAAFLVAGFWLAGVAP